MDKITPIGSALMEPLRAARAAAPEAAGAGGFGAALTRALEQVDGAQQAAGAHARRFQLGDSAASLEETMISMQKANISFQALVQVRNRVVSAYHDIMNMPV